MGNEEEDSRMARGIEEVIESWDGHDENFVQLLETMAPTLENLLEHLQTVGLTEDDLITLIARKVMRHGISRSKIKHVLNAISEIEDGIPDDD